MMSACSEKEDGGSGGNRNAKLVRKIHKYGDDYVLEYDSENRIIKYGDYTFSYNGNTMTVLNSNRGRTYTCTLNSAGYATKIVEENSEEQISCEHTYDKNGYLTHCKETIESWTDNWSFNWSNGNITSISGPWSNKFTYGSDVNTPINLNLFYITDDYGCENGGVFGFLGFMGRQNKNLPISCQDEDGGTQTYKYEFNADGTVAKVTYGELEIELYY